MSLVVIMLIVFVCISAIAVPVAFGELRKNERLEKDVAHLKLDLYTKDRQLNRLNLIENDHKMMLNELKVVETRYRELRDLFVKSQSGYARKKLRELLKSKNL